MGGGGSPPFHPPNFPWKPVSLICVLEHKNDDAYSVKPKPDGTLTLTLWADVSDYPAYNTAFQLTSQQLILTWVQ